MFIEKSVHIPINLKYGIIIGFILILTFWSLWMNYVAFNILDIQSEQIIHKNNEICKLYEYLDSITEEVWSCVITRAPEFRS